MNRRELLKMISAVTGTALIGGAVVGLSGCTTSAPVAGALSFTTADIALMDEIAETILPRTDTPGAKDAEVGKFMSVYVADCYTLEQQAIFYQGLQALEEHCRNVYSRSFMALDPAERTALVAQLDRDARAQAASRGQHHYFTMLKQLTLLGFFTSEAGATQVLRHVPIPGRYDGALPYQPGDRAWATS
jgi:hypothetical protein